MSSKQLLNSLAEIAKHASKQGFDRILSKVELVEAESCGRVLARFTVSADMLNSHGSLHGGCTATLVDLLSTLALRAAGSQTFGVSSDLSCSYMRAAMAGEVVTMEAVVLKNGKTLSFSSVDLRNQKGELLAQGKHTKYMGI